MNTMLKKRVEEKEKEYKGNEYSRPILLMLEITNACNHSCLFCDHNKMSRKIAYMDYEFAIRIMKEGYDLGIREIAMFLSSEPLLYKDLDMLVKVAKEIGYEYVYITTNGVLATLDKMKLLLQAGLDSVKFSINAIDRKNYAIIHGQDNFEKVIKNLKDLYTYKKENKLPVNIFVSSIKTKYNPSKEKIHSLLGQWCDEVIVENCIDKLEIDRNKYLKDNIEKDDGVDVIVGNRIPCQMLFNRVCVSVEGYLTACCSDIQNALAYADLNKTSLKEAWNNDLITIVRKKHLEGKLDNTLCKICAGKYGEIEPLCNEYYSKAFEQTDNDIENKRIESYKYLDKMNL